MLINIFTCSRYVLKNNSIGYVYRARQQDFPSNLTSDLLSDWCYFYKRRTFQSKSSSGSLSDYYIQAETGVCQLTLIISCKQRAPLITVQMWKNNQL